MALIHITDAAKLQKGDKVIVAPFGVHLFQNPETELDEQDGVLGFQYNDDKFFPVVTSDGELMNNLALFDATRKVFIVEAPERIGKEVLSPDDLPADYGVRVIVRHPEYGDYRGFASDDAVDGWESIHLIDEQGHGSFGFWRSGGYTIHLAVGLDYAYNL